MRLRGSCETGACRYRSLVYPSCPGTPIFTSLLLTVCPLFLRESPIQVTFFILSGGTRALPASFVNLVHGARSRCLFSKRGPHPRRPFDFHRFRDMLIPVLPPPFVPHVCHRLNFHQLPPVGKYFASHRTSMFHWAWARPVPSS